MLYFSATMLESGKLEVLFCFYSNAPKLTIHRTYDLWIIIISVRESYPLYVSFHLVTGNVCFPATIQTCNILSKLFVLSCTFRRLQHDLFVKHYATRRYSGENGNVLQSVRCTSVPSHIWLKYRCMWRKIPINSKFKFSVIILTHLNWQFIEHVTYDLLLPSVCLL